MMVQFESSVGLSNYELSRQAREISEAKSMTVTEGQHIPPVFETEQRRTLSGRLVIGSDVPKSRYNLVSNDNLIRVILQSDRFGVTWVRNRDVAYPRFESIREQFFEIFKLFKNNVRVFLGADIDVVQAEVQYVNILEDNGFALNNFNFMELSSFRDYEGLQFATTQRLTDFDEVGRLYLEVQSEFLLEMASASEAIEKRVLKLYLTFRGIPSNQGDEGLEKFLNRGRHAIVRTFSQSLSDVGKKQWGERDRING